MAAKDRYHALVRVGLEKAGWLITHDPYPLQAGGYDLEIDLGAEQIIAAEREGQRIAVEIKSFLGPSKISEFYGALGQFLTYRKGLKIQDPKRTLYLAISNSLYEKFFSNIFIEEMIKDHSVFLLVYNIDKEEIDRWIP